MGFDLGTVANIAGSLIGAGSSLAGGMINATTSKIIAREQMRLQKEFAQNGIQWRVEDAKKAGLHPLYAIGASGATYTPVSQDSSAMGNAVADAGAYLGKAVDQSIDRATRKELEQENVEYQRLMREGNIEMMRQNILGKKLDNDYVMQQLKNSQKTLASGNPGRPLAVSTPMGEIFVNNPDVKRYTSKVSGNGASALAGVNLKKADVTLSTPENPAQVAGANSDYQLIRSRDGYEIVASQPFADATDDDYIAKGLWQFRHFIGDRLDPPDNLNSASYPLPNWAPKGTVWRYNRFVGGYRPYHDGDWLTKRGARIIRNRYFW